MPWPCLPPRNKNFVASLSFLCLVTRYKNVFDQREIKKMSLSVQHSVVEQFSFNGKKVQSVHVKGEECFVSRDVYKAIGYKEENGKKAIQNLVPSKYKLRFGDVNPLPSQGGNIFPLHKDTVLIKEPGFIAFSCVAKSIRLSLSWSGLWK